MPSEAKRGAVRILANYTRLGATVTLGLILVPILIHGIGQDGYGLYALVGASVGFAQMFKDIARASMNRELGAAWHAGNPDLFRRTYLAACLISLALALLSALAFVLLALIVPWLEVPTSLHNAARWAILAAGANTFITVSLSPQFNMYMVTERMVAYNSRQTLERLFYTGVAAALFLALDVGDPANPSRGFILFSILANAASAIVTTASIIPIVRAEPLLRPRLIHLDRATLRRVLGTSGWNAVTSTAMNLHLRVDALLMNLFFALSGSASFGLAMTLTSYIRMLTVGVTDGLDAVTARVSSAEDSAKAVRALLSHTTRLAAAIALPAGVFVIALTRPMLDVWVGHRTPHAAPFIPAAVPIVQVLVVGMTVRAITDNWMRILYGAGHVARYARQVLAGGLLNPIAAIAYLQLVDRDATLAPACAYSGVFIVVHLLLLPRTAHQALGVPYADVLAPLARPLLATAIAAPIPIAAALLIPSWNLPTLAGIAFAFGAIYFPLAWKLVLAPPERQRLIKAIARRTGRRASPQ